MDSRHSRSKNGVASLAYGWSEFLTHDTSAAERLAHPRGAWLDPSTGHEIAQGALLREVASRQHRHCERSEAIQLRA